MKRRKASASIRASGGGDATIGTSAAAAAGRVSFQTMVLSCLFLLSSVVAASASTSVGFAGLDAETLRSLGVPESEIDVLMGGEDDTGGNLFGDPNEDADYGNGEDEVVEGDYQDFDNDADEEDLQDFEYDSYDDIGDDEWWRDPLGRYEDDVDVDEERQESDDVHVNTDTMPKGKDNVERPPNTATGSADAVDTSKVTTVKTDKPKRQMKNVSWSLPFSAAFGSTGVGNKRKSAPSTDKASKKGAANVASQATRGGLFPSARFPLHVPPSLVPIVAKTAPTVPIILSLGLANYAVSRIRIGGTKSKSSQVDNEDREGYDHEDMQFDDTEHNRNMYRTRYDDGLNEEEKENFDEKDDYHDVVDELGGGTSGFHDSDYLGDDATSRHRSHRSTSSVRNDVLEASGATQEADDQPEAFTGRLATNIRRVVAFGKGIGGRKQRIPGFPSRRAIRRNDEMQALAERAETAEGERDTIEREYESSSRQLHGLQQQLQAMEKTNGYLKAQLRDLQRSSESTILAERKKSNEEMARVRESLVAVLDRERRLMRAQMMKASERLRSLMEEEIDNGSGDEEFEWYGEKQPE